MSSLPLRWTRFCVRLASLENILEVIPMTADQAGFSAADRRVVRRRNLKHSVEISVRKGAMGLGPNIAAGGVELSADGVQLEVTDELRRGDEIEIHLTGVGRSKAVKFMADVRWCQPEPGGRTYLIGAGFRRRLTHNEISEFV
jgi:PilZ domain